MHRCFIDLKKTGSILDVILVQCCCVEQKTLSYRGLTSIVAWIEFLMSFPQKRESREYLSELYSKFLYNFAYFKCFFWIPAFAGMTYSTFLDPCNNATAKSLVAIRKIIVILNLFQDLLQEMLKQVQHDKTKLPRRQEASRHDDSGSHDTLEARITS